MSSPVGGRNDQGCPEPAEPDLLVIDRAALRQCLLAVSVTADIDMLPADDGIVLPGIPPVEVAFADCARALAGAAPDSSLGQRRLGRWLRVRRGLAERSLDELAESIRPVGLPVGHELHPGRGWVRHGVLGGCMDVGIGFAGLAANDPDRVVVTPASALAAAGIDPTPWWPTAIEYLENMGALATTRWRRSLRAPLRPMGDCDVVTLLASAVFRGALCADAGGMRPIAVPMRHRGWLDLSRIDPAFAQAAAALTDVESRGFARPVLLTVDEVAMVGEGGFAATIALRDPAIDQPTWMRDTLYR